MTRLSDYHAPLRSRHARATCPSMNWLAETVSSYPCYLKVSISLKIVLPHLRSSMPPQRQRNRLPTEELARAMGMLECGYSQRRVANVFGVSQSVISSAWNRIQTYGSATQCHSGGRKRATTPREDRFLMVQARRHPFVNATTLRNEFRNAVGANISTQTVRNRLRQSGLRSRRACIRIPLTRLHKQAHLHWTQDHVNFTENDWDPVLFTDESWYCLDFTDRRARVRRRRGERFQDANISEHDRYGGGSIMVWAGNSRGRRTDLHIVTRTMMTGVRYRDEILDVYVRPYAGTIRPQFILMEDNARPHRARVVQDYLQQETIVRMYWPACSHDVNPIEHVWNMLQLAILRRSVQPRTLVELGNALTEEWNNLEMAAIQRLIGSMIAVIASRGSHTSY